jgi:hypothetical protein
LTVAILFFMVGILNKKRRGLETRAGRFALLVRA